MDPTAEPGAGQTVPPAKRTPAKRAAKKATPAQKITPADESAPAKRGAPVKKATPVKKAAPVKKSAPAKKVVPAKRAATNPEPAASTEPAASPEPAASTEPAASVATTEGVTSTETSANGTDAETATIIPFTTGVPRRATYPTPVERFESLTEELLADPGRSPAILALAAVRTFGPRAKIWAGRTRAAYPAADREALARLAVRRFTRAAGLRGAAGALAGPYTPIALTAAVLVTHAELVLHLAAAFGLDPEDPRRADDLLLLASPGQGPVVAWLATSLINRRLPGVSLITAVLGSRSTTEAVAVRARRFYRDNQLSQESGSKA